VEWAEHARGVVPAGFTSGPQAVEPKPLAQAAVMDAIRQFLLPAADAVDPHADRHAPGCPASGSANFPHGDRPELLPMPREVEEPDETTRG
jgi:hypothetical protein